MGDDHLYFKFRAINKHMIESLVNPSLYFVKPDALNDPFDCLIDLRHSFSRAALLSTGNRKAWLMGALDNNEFLKMWGPQFENFGVCSFSLNPSETLLWSHYADAHKGACLLYRFPESFLSDPSNIMGVDEVKYDAEAFTEFLKNAPMEMFDFFEELMKIYLTTKSPAWGYEKEVRIIRGKHGLFNIPGEFLEQVCFGLRTPPADIDLIMKLAKKYCGCKKFCQMFRDESDFGFTMKEL